MNDFLNNIINEKKEKIFYTAIVSSLDPLQVKFYPNDSAITVKTLTGVLGIQVNSNVVLIKILSAFLIIGVIGSVDSASGVPVGSVTSFAGSSSPSGWLLCDGSAVSRTTYSNLFSLIGTTYGTGDGSTTFNLPNLKGRVPVGYNSSESEFNTLGETGGAKTHTLTESQIPSHDHSQSSHYHNIRWKYFDGLSAGSTWALLRRYESGDSYDGTDNAALSTTANNNNTGGGGSHNNLQPYIALNYIIKY